MHHLAMPTQSTAKPARLTAETAHESTPSLDANRARRLSRDTIQLRCLTPADGHHVTDLLGRLSQQSRYQRYFRLIRTLAPADVARFVALSPDHVAVGAFDGNLLVGAAQYFRLSGRPEHAEVALEVADSHHRRGVGARLVRELARLAAGEGITHFTATVLAENRPVLELMRHSGWHIATTPDGTYSDVVVTLPPELVGAGAGCACASRAS
jgi:GNAT superfamily N-acetyltransferase